MARPIIDLTGQRFGRLTVERFVGIRCKNAVFRCKCDCGNIIDTYATHLKSGKAKSCGCYRNEVFGVVDGTKAVNLNDTMYGHNRSGIKGVAWHAKTQKWRARITFRRHEYHLGLYETAGEATAARKEAEQRIWGDFLEWYNNEYGKEKTPCAKKKS